MSYILLLCLFILESFYVTFVLSIFLSFMDLNMYCKWHLAVHSYTMYYNLIYKICKKKVSGQNMDFCNSERKDTLVPHLKAGEMLDLPLKYKKKKG